MDDEEEQTIIEPVTIPFLDIAALSERDVRQSESIPTDILSSNQKDVSEESPVISMLSKEKDLLYDFQEGPVADGSLEETLSERQFMQESASDLKIEDLFASNEDVYIEGVINKAHVEEMSDTDGKHENIFQEFIRDQPNKEKAADYQAGTLAEEKEYEVSGAFEVKQGTCPTDNAKKDFLGDKKVYFGTIGAISAMSIRDDDDDVVAEITQSSQDLTEIQLSSNEEDLKIDTPRRVDRHVKDMYTHEKLMPDTPIPQEVPKKSNWKKFKKFVYLGLATSSKKSKNITFSEPQALPYLPPKNTANPEITSQQPTRPFVRTSTQNSGRPLN